MTAIFAGRVTWKAWEAVRGPLVRSRLQPTSGVSAALALASVPIGPSQCQRWGGLSGLGREQAGANWASMGLNWDRTGANWDALNHGWTEAGVSQLCPACRSLCSAAVSSIRAPSVFLGPRCLPRGPRPRDSPAKPSARFLPLGRIDCREWVCPSSVVLLTVGEGGSGLRQPWMLDNECRRWSVGG